MPFSQRLQIAGLACAFFSATATAQQGAHAFEAGSSMPVKPDARKAERLYAEGARLLDRMDPRDASHRNLGEARARFSAAAALNPGRADYALAASVTRDREISDLIQQSARERLLNHATRADALVAEAKALDPRNELVLEHTASAEPPPPVNVASAAAGFAGPIHVRPTLNRADVRFSGDSQQAVAQTAALFGVKTVFQDAIPPLQLKFALEQTTYDQAMPILLRMAHLFAVTVDETTVIVARDTEENRLRLERQIEETIYVPGSTVEQLNELSNIVKNVYDVQKVVLSQAQGALFIRAPEPTIKALNATLSDLIDNGSEVVLDVKLLTVDKSKIRNTGTQTPTSISAFSVASELRNFVNANQAVIAAAIASGAYTPTGVANTDLVAEAVFLLLSGAATDPKLTNLLTFFGGGLTLFGLSLPGGANLNLALNSSESHALEDISIRVGDRQTSTLRVGAKYPITTSTYSSGISSALTSALAGKTINGVSVNSLLQQYAGGASTVPMVQYEDLGITLKTTPAVLKSGLVSMKIDLKLEALTGQSSNNIPVLTSRAFTSDITVEDGVTAVMLSEVSSTEAASISGLPGLADLPGFQQTTADKLRQVDSSELVLLITPHVIRHRSGAAASRRIVFQPSVPQDF